MPHHYIKSTPDRWLQTLKKSAVFWNGTFEWLPLTSFWSNYSCRYSSYSLFIGGTNNVRSCSQLSQWVKESFSMPRQLMILIYINFLCFYYLNWKTIYHKALSFWLDDLLLTQSPDHPRHKKCRKICLLSLLHPYLSLVSAPQPLSCILNLVPWGTTKILKDVSPAFNHSLGIMW